MNIQQACVLGVLIRLHLAGVPVLEALRAETTAQDRSGSVPSGSDVV